MPSPWLPCRATFAALLAACAGLLLPATLWAEVRVVSSVYPPFRNTPTTGLTNELFLAACQAAGLTEVKIEMLPSERARRSFEQDRDTVYIESDSNLPSLEALAPGQIRMLRQWPFQSYVYYRKAAFAPGGPQVIKDLNDKLMGYYRADRAARDYFERHGARSIAIDPHDRVYAMLLRGRVDFLLSVEATAEFEFGRRNPRWREQVGLFGPIYKGYSGAIYRQDSAAASAFVERYLDGYKRIIEDGTLRRIAERYFGKGAVLPPGLAP
ncbi:ABC transporter substrate-binding protein [Pelomonas sp. SE-A7]|uniref:substrate-binding periplasmic protein n=1 Tax=Pelomonas sp. SE-A7 TaxID=3054953 RepID=UPI00259D0642|nr:ABC transporter substrate-binding protein [Pelomonas sp. SE-A7]MDM4768431.1 ABC transporter substrate-binding protein [Pelomonas sp. SE-A7]